MSKGWSTRFATQRFDKMFDAIDEALTAKAQKHYQEAADEAAEWWSNRVRASGRGGRHNSEMANIRGAVTQPRKGGFFVRMGWLDSPPRAADGRTTWFVYQDMGYDPFGMRAKGYNAAMVPGLLLQMDARRMLSEGLRDANAKIARDVRSAVRSKR